MVDPLASGNGDPTAKISDPTGGAPNINILDVFKQFGYYPSQAEINAIAPSFEGRYDITATGTSAVSQYVLQKQAEAEREKNDPLVALQTKMDDSVTLMKNQVHGLYGQLQDTLSAAPQLFGSLTPDQIQEYLAPLKTTFDKQMASVQGIIGSRGLAASSTENNALAETNKQFQEQVFSTGLGVGLDAQKNKATAIQQQINNLFGLTGTEEGISGAAAAQRSQQNLGQSNLIASLPFFLDQAAAQRSAMAEQEAKSGGFWDTFNKVTSGINKGVDTFQNLMMVPQQLKTQSAPTPGMNAPNLPAAGSTLMPGGSSSPLSLTGSTAAAPPALFAAP
jgi:hypothetical protein